MSLAGRILSLVPDEIRRMMVTLGLLTAGGAPAYTGTVGGNLGSTDNKLLRAHGTGGNTAQDSPITVDDSGNITGAGTYNGVTVAAGGPSEFDATVATYAALITALAAGYKNILITANLTATADITFPNTVVRLYALPGQSITIAMGAYQFIGGGAANSVYSENLLYTYAYASAKELFSGTTALVELKNGNSVNTSSSNSTPIVVSTVPQRYEEFTVTCGNGTTRGVSVGSVRFDARNLHIVGGGTSCTQGVAASSAARGEWVGGSVSGTFQASGAAINVAVPCFGLNLTATTSGTLYYFFSKEFVGPTNSFSGAIFYSNGTGVLRGGRALSSAGIEFSGTGAAVDCTGVGTIDFAASSDNIVRNVNCTTITSTSGANNRLHACILSSGIGTIPSASAYVFVDCVIAGGTIASGAGATFDACRFTTLPTNNDPEGTRFIGCTPAGFSNTTIDASIRHLTSYFRFNEASGSFRSSAPFNKNLVLAPVGSITYAQAGIEGSGKGISFSEGAYLSTPVMPTLPPGTGSEFSINFWYKPTDATPAALEDLLSAAQSGTVGFEIALDSTGVLKLWVDSSVVITGTTVLSDATQAMITLVRRNVAGTVTWFIYLNATSEGSTTSGATHNISVDGPIQIGRFNATDSWNPGLISSLSTWSCALSASQITALYNSGTGRFLSVVA